MRILRWGCGGEGQGGLSERFEWRWKSILPAAAVFLLCLGLYLPVLPSDLSWANGGSDSGDFLAALLTGGIPHPTGYPTYLLAGRLFLSIPIETPVWRAAFLSACSAAAAAALLCAWIQRQFAASLPGGLSAGIAAAVSLALGVSPLYYSQAVIVEVYGLQSLFFVLSLWWIDQLVQARERPASWRMPALLALCYGLGLGNHVTGILAFPPVLFFLAQGARKRRWGWLVLQLAALLLGCAVYLILPLRAAQYPPVNWGNPQTLAGLLWLVSAIPYQGLLFQTQPVEIIERTGALARLLVEQFGLLGVLFGVTGLIMRPLICLELHLSLLWIAAVTSLFAIGYAANDSSAYLIPFFIIWAVWIAMGIGAVIQTRIHWRRVPIGWFAGMVFLLAILPQAPATIRQMNPRAHPDAAAYAARAMQEAPPGAILFTNSDLDTFPLWYQHFGLRQRPDVRVIVLPLTQFPWYRDTIRHIYNDLILPADDFNDQWGQQLPGLNPLRPVCRTRVEHESPPSILFRCDPD